MINNNFLPGVPFYNNQWIFNQLYTLKSYEITLKKLIFFGSNTPIFFVPINKNWFSKWKKLTCYEAIKDMINIEITPQQSFNNIFNSYSLMVQTINKMDKEQLNPNMRNENFYEKLNMQTFVNPKRSFELISADLYKLLIQNTTKNNNDMITLQGCIVNNMIIIDLNPYSFYVFYWKKEKETLGKMVLIFNDLSQKEKMKNNLASFGMPDFCASYSIDIDKPNGEVNYGNINFKYLNKENEIKKKLPPVGLLNIGNTCYMNAALQCLINVDKLSDFLLDQENIKLMNSNKGGNYLFADSYIKLLENLYRRTPESEDNEDFVYSPGYIRDIFYSSDSLFQGNAGDSIDLIMIFLQKMHEELNKFPKKSQPFFSNYISDIMYNQNMEQQQITSISNFIQNNSSGVNETNSIISNTFFVIECSKTKCLNCYNCSYDFQFKNYIIFPLDEVRKFSEVNRGTSLSSVTLMECFCYYVKTNSFTGNNQIFCSRCGFRTDAENSTSFYSLPDTLIINLNRGKGNIFNVGIEFEENLDLNGFETYNGHSRKYKLTGLVTHTGSSGVGGHYMAFCYKDKDKKWYLFNDAIVSESDLQTAKSTGDIYVLFYKRVDNK